jgi:cell surface protein SprA
MLPGFNRNPFLLGMDTSWASPGWSFLFGSQNPEYRYEAARKGWIMQDTLFSTPFTQAKTYDLNLKATVEPAKSFRIQLDAKKSATGNFLELFRVNQNVSTNEFEYNGVNTSRSGSYSISINTMKTSFIKDDDNNNSPVFNTFEENLDIIRNRLQAQNVNEGQYSRKSQDVMIPAFIAAYTGKDPNKVALNPFPKIPIPGWRVDFSGLGEIKALKKNFSSINLTHSYSSTYTINNYSNSLKYQNNLELDALLNYYPMPSDTNEVGEFVSPFLMSQVVIQERYGPLFGINIRTKSRMTFRLDFKKERNLALNMSNSQITELKSSDISLDFGFTKADLKLPFKSQGRVITLKNDVTFKLNLTIRDTKTIQRKIDDVNTITAGNMNFQLKPQVSYVLNDRLNLNIYFERNVNMPQVTTSYPRSTSQFGIQARFSLAQ